MSTGILMGNTTGIYTISATLDPAAVSAATSAEQTFTVAGLKVGDMVLVSKPTATAGVGIVNARVSAADTLALTFMNATAGSVNPASETYTITVIRIERQTASTAIID